LKPEFLFIGPHKSGTTWVDHYLRSRGDVLLPQLTKETFWFDKLHSRGMDWYEAQFGTPGDQHRTCIEVAPSLLDKPEAARRVARELPGVTVICTLRNPVERAVAHYFHHRKGGEPSCNFGTMAKKHPEILNNGFYYRHLCMWTDLLGPDRVKLLPYELLKREPVAYCERICALLSLPLVIPSDEILYARINEDGDPPFRLLAMLARRGAETLRFAGAHKLVNFVRTPTVRRLAYGRPPDPKEWARVSVEAHDYYGDFLADFQNLDRAYGIDTSGWRTASPPRNHA